MSAQIMVHSTYGNLQRGCIKNIAYHTFIWREKPSSQARRSRGFNKEIYQPRLKPMCVELELHTIVHSISILKI